MNPIIANRFLSSLFGTKIDGLLIVVDDVTNLIPL